MGKLTTHVLDVADGVPGVGMRISLYALDPERKLVKSVHTNADGRTDAPLLDESEFAPGNWEIEFSVGEYFRARDAVTTTPPFLDDVVVRFGLAEGGRANYHVPLLCSPWSYSTYRGS